MCVLQANGACIVVATPIGLTPHSLTRPTSSLTSTPADPEAQTGQLDTAVGLAAARGAAEALETLLHFGADVEVCNARGATPLFLAVDNNRPGACALVDCCAGARFHRQPRCSPLHPLPPDVIELLLGAGADVAARVKHRTPRSFAKRRGLTDLAATLKVRPP